MSLIDSIGDRALVAVRIRALAESATTIQAYFILKSCWLSGSVVTRTIPIAPGIDLNHVLFSPKTSTNCWLLVNIPAIRIMTQDSRSPRRETVRLHRRLRRGGQRSGKWVKHDGRPRCHRPQPDVDRYALPPVLPPSVERSPA